MQFQICYPPSVECFDPYILHCLYTSIEDEPAANRQKVDIYPVPAYDHVNIRLNMAGNIYISIYDLIGSEVFRQTVQSSGEVNIPVPVRNLPEGMYIVTIRSEQEIISRKLSVKK